MSTVKATVRGGRLELEEPINLPDGTELLIPLPNGPGKTEEDGWDNWPAGIADWLNCYDSLQPLVFTAAEEADAEAWLKKMDEYGDCPVAWRSRGREKDRDFLSVPGLKVENWRAETGEHTA